jgi:hypothetical protein
MQDIAGGRKKTKAQLREVKKRKKMPISGKSTFRLKSLIEKKASKSSKSAMRVD